MQVLKTGEVFFIRGGKRDKIGKIPDAQWADRCYASSPVNYMSDQLPTSTPLPDESTAPQARRSEQEASEEARREAEQYRSLFEQAPIGIFHFLPEGRFLRVNFKLAQMLGYASPEELISTITNIRTQVFQDSIAYENLLGFVRQRADWVYAANRFRRKDGSIVLVRLMARQVFQLDGTLAYLEGFLEDVSEQRRLVSAEREQRTLAEALRDTARAITDTLNLDEVFDRILQNVGRVVPHNAALIMLLDEARKTAAVARYYGYMPPTYEERSYSLRLDLAQTRNLRTLYETGLPLVIEDVQQYDGWLVLPYGEWIRSYAGVAIRVQDEVIGFLNLYSLTPGFYSDSQAGRLQAFADQAAIAIQNARLHAQLEYYADELEERIAERTRELTLANERLRELDQLKDEFMARIGHELLTPLANVKNYLDLLKTSRPERQTTYLKTLRHETDRLLVLIEDLLQVRQLSVDDVELVITPVDVNQLIGQRIAGWAEQATRRGLEFHTRLAADLPPVLVDRYYTSHVLGHVVNNALNYTPAGSITLVTESRSDEEGRWVTISVIDTGPGIAPTDLPYIFDRFYRGHAAADYKTPGVGVGLSISREIMIKLNGRLTVETESGVGSTFTIWLPL